MSREPRQQLVDEARRVLTAMRRLGFHDIAVRRMEQAIVWMESDVREVHEVSPFRHDEEDGA